MKLATMYLDFNRNAAKIRHHEGLKTLPLWGKVFFFLCIYSYAFANDAHAVALSELKNLESKQEAQVRVLRQEETRELERILALNDGSKARRKMEADERAEFYLRLANVLIEEYRALFLLESRYHARLSNSDPMLAADRRLSKAQLAKGIAACEKILDLGIPYSKLDQVYYLLSYLYFEKNEFKNALTYHEALVKRFPNSVYTSGSYFELGQAAFSRGEYEKAEFYLSKAAAGLKSEEKANATHKLAWTYFRQKKFSPAIETMKKTISLASSDQANSIRDEALRDLGLFMSRGAPIGEATAYFKALSGSDDEYLKVLESLGQSYERSAQAEDAIATYEKVQQASRSSDQQVRVRSKLVKLYINRGDFKNALRTAERLTDAQSDDDASVVALRSARASVRTTAIAYHQNFRRTAVRDSLVVAEGLYSVYLKMAPEKELNEIRMYLAEVKASLKKHKEAVKYYDQVIESGDSNYYFAACILKAGELSEILSDPSAGESFEAAYVDVARRLEKGKQSSSTREIRLKASQFLAGQESRWGESVEMARALVKESPESSQAEVAARLWLQILGDRLRKNPENGETHREIVDAANEIQGVIKNPSPQLKEFLLAAESKGRLGQIAAYEKKNDFDSAARGYEEFARTSKDADLSEKALGNALGATIKARNGPHAVSLSELWLAKFPKSARAKEELRAAATDLLIQGDLTSAGEVFERIGILLRDSTSLELSAVLYSAVGDGKRATGVRNRYLKLFGNEPSHSTVRVLLELAKSQELETDGAEEALSAYAKCQAMPLRSECWIRRARLLRKLGRIGEANRLYANPPKTADPFGRAEAMYYLAVPETSDPKLEKTKLKSGFEARVKKLEKMTKATRPLVEGGNAWSVRSLMKLAEYTERLGDDLAEVNQEKEGQELAQSIKDKAKKLLSRAWEKTQKENIFLGEDAKELARRVGETVWDKQISFVFPKGDISLDEARARLVRQKNSGSAWLGFATALLAEQGSKAHALVNVSMDFALRLSPGLESAKLLQLVAQSERDGLDDDLVVETIAGKLESLTLPEAKINLGIIYLNQNLAKSAASVWQKYLSKVGPETVGVESVRESANELKMKLGGT